MYALRSRSLDLISDNGNQNIKIVSDIISYYTNTIFSGIMFPNVYVVNYDREFHGR